MLIHGFAEDMSIWHHQIDYLKNKFRLIIPDIPGSGGSSPLTLFKNGSPPAIMDDYAACLLHLLDQEGIEKCNLVGHSMGGYVALAFAELYPSRINKLSLFHSTAFPDSEEKKAARRKSNEFIKSYGSAPFIEQAIPNLFDEPFRKSSPEKIENLIERYANFPAEALVSYYEAMILRPDRTHVLQNFKNPVQFIIGENDKAVPLEQSLRQCHIPQISYIHVLEKSAHMGMLEDPDETNRMLENFLDRTL
ncbi:MAG: alpha/beta hydrolase [Bacteroidetes bacterium]|nr:MAG: alpha/beta hydrolase [Bacteroidota bacterium]